METSLHRQLKARYADDPAQCEVRLGRYRIDAVVDDELIEIQHGSLAAIRDKVRHLLNDHKVRIVKPIIQSKRIIRFDKKDGKVVSRRRSPKRGSVLDIFSDLVYCTRLFPHRRLTIEVALVDVEELRYPGHGRRRRWRKNDFQIEDQQLVDVHETVTLRSHADLRKLLGAKIPQPFDTAQLAQSVGIDRWDAQRIAYCLREMGTTKVVDKRGNALVYRFRRNPRRRQRPAA